MNSSTTPSTSGGGRRRGRGGGKSSEGWAAFHLQQQQQQQQNQVLGKDPYPPFFPFPPPPPPPYSSTSTAMLSRSRRRNNDAFSSKSFSSALSLPSSSAAGGFPALKTQHRFVDNNNEINNNDLTATPVVDFSAGNSSCNGKVIEQEQNGNTNVSLKKKLKELHGWADCDLIEDVMATVDNDFSKASALLGEMVSNTELEENVEAEFGSAFDKSLDADIADLSSTLENAFENNDNNSKELRDGDNVDASSCGCVKPQRHSDDDAIATANMKLILGHLKSVPVEPEWEEDDVYLTHRKNALRMMRSASHHSKAAANAFLRRDHFSAQQHSLKAQEEWSAAEQLNAKAAKEILSIRNSENDLWKLDLHGLHAAEAVQALREHLLNIENQPSLNRSTSPSRVKTKDGIVYSLPLKAKNGIHSSPLSTSSNMHVDILDKQQSGFRQRPTSLEVITGIGKHSQGQAALPMAVRSFLNENGYRFDETRPGVIMIRPKFRHR